MLKLAIIMTVTEPFLVFKEAQLALEEQYPGEFSISMYNTTELDNNKETYDACLEATKDADFVFMNIHGSLSFFKSFKDYYGIIKGNKKFFINTTIEEEVAELFPESGIMPEDFEIIYKYYKSGGSKNLGNLVKWLGNQFGRGKYAIDDPACPKWSGIYDPDFDTEYEEAYLEKVRESKDPVVGIIVNVLLLQKKNLAHVDALIRSVRNQGAVPLCVYSDMLPDSNLGCEGIRATLERCMMYEGRTVVDSIINTTAFSLTILADPGDGSKPKETSVFDLFDVPVMQAMTTLQSYEEWNDSVRGLDGLSLSWSVFQPEFDGQIIAYPYATSEKVDTDLGPKKVSMPIEDRVESIVSLAINWAKLRHIKNDKKKVAIILHNNPPRNDNIGGAAGLDTPVSVFDMVSRLEETGVQTDYRFSDGKDIIDRIINGLTNDGRWSSPESMLEKSIDTVNEDKYREWYERFIPRIKENLVKYWGEPPGDFMAVDDKILIPGILNGNIFIGLQPPRAFEEKAEEMYHSTDIPCPHQYIGFYNWVEKVFEADVIVHVGTHGTVEWLPGKEVGLSKDCYSDICIGTVPHLYSYIINAPGEGSAAKRRTYAALVDYMVASMVESGVYDELAEMDELMKQYYHVKAADPKKIPLVEKQIVDLAVRMNLNDDLAISLEEMEADAEECIKKLHSWVSNIQACDINDGFHIFGMVPKGDRFRNMLKMLVRNRNGDVPSFRKSVCDMLGLDFEELLASPETATKDGKSYGILLAEADETGRDIFLELEKNNFDEKSIGQIIDLFKVDDANDVESLKTCLGYVCNFVKPRVMRITDEMDNFIGGVNGRFVPPGPSGAPTRGNAAILPTGRNFYSVDPGAMPSRSSWEIGKTLGDQLLERYLNDEGEYPESVSMLVYATESMRTYGDDIAETFYLLGARPVWLGTTDRVIGIEAIPMEELGRPRIDVTLRITGLFRDAFPNLIERVEDAVNLVASLDEDDEVNYVKKHVDEEVAELVKQGVDLELAQEHSLIRVFGDAPGAYGAGVCNVVESKKWNDVTDLGKVYTTWGCHAYGKKLHGDKMPELFALRMKKVNVAVKNESTREVDMLDSDDFYNYFGGMVAAITTHSGSQKPAYIPSTSDTDHVETLTLHEEASRVMRARVNNPKWVEGLKKHGYRGAKQVSAMMDFTFGWDATTDVIDDWMYDCIAERYVFNKENSDWMRDVNPWALHSVTERLLEANQRNMWNASEESVEKLTKVYMEMEGNIEELG
ncbi:cobaltochelatase CobN [Dethiosulfatibacter aminovorans DSM 17477]|uniref:Cobaltochelatase CobN n=1 Tax=Dethiosulfatibacter aminovorans DSM 17477 TaxID=1121476 RepID=A0A1M6LX19_9FIRM|nr:cobaltochelatase subunit CobN [Dethiosulfatibacter aminovorans]SHJ75807.1 cobaltochelatase CobN [Dethiosulfatibacter aminovorans DSM 17477]